MPALTTVERAVPPLKPDPWGDCRSTISRVAATSRVTRDPSAVRGSTELLIVPSLLNTHQILTDVLALNIIVPVHRTGAR